MSGGYRVSIIKLQFNKNKLYMRDNLEGKIKI